MEHNSQSVHNAWGVNFEWKIIAGSSLNGVVDEGLERNGLGREVMGRVNDDLILICGGGDDDQ